MTLVPLNAIVCRVSCIARKIGGSQGKFKPQRDTYAIMAKRNSKVPPKMLANVLKAISDLKDARGSTLQKIVEQINVKCTAENRRRPRNINMHVRRALRHGTQSGVVLYQGGKYKLGISGSAPKIADEKNLPVKEAKRQRRPVPSGNKRRRRRRRRRRASSVSTLSPSDGEASDAGSETCASDVSDKSGRKRRRRRSRRRRRKTTENELEIPDRSASRKRQRLDAREG